MLKPNTRRAMHVYMIESLPFDHLVLYESLLTTAVSSCLCSKRFRTQRSCCFLCRLITNVSFSVSVEEGSRSQVALESTLGISLFQPLDSVCTQGGQDAVNTAPPSVDRVGFFGNFQLIDRLTIPVFFVQVGANSSADSQTIAYWCRAATLRAVCLDLHFVSVPG